MLNGKSGLLQISGDDKSVTIDKLQLAGEGVSDSSQRCIVDIVGETPIEATNVGRPDGLERFEAKVPACPISFDVLGGAVLAPTQVTACVFKAADCQTAPGGLWGPDGASLVGDAAKIVKERAVAEKAMGKILHAIEDRAEDSTQAADARARSERLRRAARRALPRLRKGKHSRLLRACASPRREWRFCRPGSMSLARQPPPPRRRAQKARRQKSKKGAKQP